MESRDDWASAYLREGELIANKYRLERVLGFGGMGMVAAARHIQLDENVAIKFLLPSIVEDPGAVGRFLREARAPAKVKSEYLAGVRDVGELPIRGPYLVMDLLEGWDLNAYLGQRGALPVEQGVTFVLQAAWRWPRSQHWHRPPRSQAREPFLYAPLRGFGPSPGARRSPTS